MFGGGRGIREAEQLNNREMESVKHQGAVTMAVSMSGQRINSSEEIVNKLQQYGILMPVSLI